MDISGDAVRRITRDSTGKKAGLIHSRGDIVWQEGQIRDGKNGGDVMDAVVSRCIL